tara:strand:- start:64 stop:528 length:465 start_codon:yes stop_codon:yes gene_type:complete
MEAVIYNRRWKLENGELFIYKVNKTCPSRWLLLKGTIGENGYKKTHIKNKDVLYHRLIYKLYNPEWNINDGSKNNHIDHIDRNKLNNNIENLRVVTIKHNQWNRDVKGYTWVESRKNWRVSIMVNRKRIEGGSFNNEEDAIAKRDELKKIYHII